MWYSGIDQHERDSVITTYGPDGPRVKQTKVANTPLTLARYFGEFTKRSGAVPRKQDVSCRPFERYLPHVTPGNLSSLF